MKKEAEKSQKQAVKKSPSGKQSDMSRKPDTNNSIYSAVAIGCFKNEENDEILIWKNEKCEPVRFVESKTSVVAVVGRERIDDKEYPDLDSAIEAYKDTNWKAVGSIAAIVARQIIENTKIK